MQTFMTIVENIPLSTFSLTMLGFTAAVLMMWGILNTIKPNIHEPSHAPVKPWMRAVKIAGFILLPIFGLLFVASVFQIISMWAKPPEEAEALALRIHYLAIIGFIGVLGGILGATTAYIRIFTTERQTFAQETGLITDRINKAVENLGATRTSRDKDNNETHDPNIEVRLGALYALERVAQDSLRDHIQIMEILTAYIRENAPASEAKPYPFEGNAPKPHVPKPNIDVQAALTIIGRRLPSQIALERADTRQGEEGYCLDLSRTNLQSAKFSYLNFSHANFSGANLGRAYFIETKLENAILFKAKLQEAYLSRTLIKGANFGSSTVIRAAFRNMDLSEWPTDDAPYISTIFGDGSVTISPNVTRPNKCGSDILETQDFDLAWYNFICRME